MEPEFGTASFWVDEDVAVAEPPTVAPSGKVLHVADLGVVITTTLPNGLDAVVPTTQKAKQINDPMVKPDVSYSAFVAAMNKLESAYGLAVEDDLAQDNLRYTLAIPTPNGQVWKVSWSVVSREFLARMGDPVGVLCTKLEMIALSAKDQLIYERNELPHNIRFWLNGEPWDGK